MKAQFHHLTPHNNNHRHDKGVQGGGFILLMVGCGSSFTVLPGGVGGRGLGDAAPYIASSLLWSRCVSVRFRLAST